MCTDYIKDIKRYPAHQNEMGSRPLAGLHHMSCMSGENSNLQRALGMVSLVVDIGRGEPEDNSKDEGRAGERK